MKVSQRVEEWNQVKKALTGDDVVLMEVLESFDLHRTKFGRRLLVELIRVVKHTHRLQIPSLVAMINKKEESKTDVLMAVKDIIWMARRYADGRRTYAPDMFNEAQKKLVDTLGMNVIGNEDKVVKDFPYATDPDVPVKERHKITYEEKKNG